MSLSWLSLMSTDEMKTAEFEEGGEVVEEEEEEIGEVEEEVEEEEVWKKRYRPMGVSFSVCA